MSMRARLVAAAAAATLAAVAALGTAVVILTAHQLRSELDHTLRQRAVDVARLAVSAPVVLRAPGALEAPFGGRQLSVEVVDRSGRPYARSLSLGDRLLPGGAALGQALAHGRASYERADFGGTSIRLYVAPLADLGGPASGGAVLVASDTSEIDDTLHHERAIVVISALVAAALGALLAAALTHHGLRPLRRLSEGASAIARTGEASRRLPASARRGELAELESALNRMLAALERARERERRFLADASHELRTPLTSLRGNAAYVAEHGADPAALRDIEADAERLGRLLDDLLALEREDAGATPLEPVRLADVVETVAGDGIAARIDAPLAQVAGDRGALERALANLLENARVHGGEEIEVSLETVGDRALLAVADDGPGLAPAQAEVATQRFWRGPGAAGRPGSGLGLAIVASTAARHGGRLRVEGSRFTLELPLLKTFSNSSPIVEEQ